MNCVGIKSLWLFNCKLSNSIRIHLKSRHIKPTDHNSVSQLLCLKRTQNMFLKQSNEEKKPLIEIIYVKCLISLFSLFKKTFHVWAIFLHIEISFLLKESTKKNCLSSLSCCPYYIPENLMPFTSFSLAQPHIVLVSVSRFLSNFLLLLLFSSVRKWVLLLCLLSIVHTTLLWLDQKKSDRYKFGKFSSYLELSRRQ
jgi:hypothetical protein